MAIGGNIVKEILDIAGIEFNRESFDGDVTSIPTYRKNPNKKNLVRLGAISRNKAYIDALRREVFSYATKLQNSKLRTVPRYYNRLTGQYQTTRPVDISRTLSAASVFEDIAETLATLVQNRVLTLETKLSVRPIDLETGDFEIPEDEAAKREISNLIGFPTSGIIKLSERLNNINQFGYSYTSVDIKAFAIFGSLIVEVKGLVGISWSKHKDKNSDRRTFESQPTAFTPGAKTYAGTMFFALFNESSLRANSPIEFFRGHDPIAPPTGMTEFFESDSTDLPGFDMCITFTNEYGASSSMNIWGITFLDEGGAITTRSLENEESFAYKAVKIDPIVPVQKGENGEINFMAPTDSGISRFERKRRMALMKDMAGGDFESAYQKSLDNIYQTFRGRGIY